VRVGGRIDWTPELQPLTVLLPRGDRGFGEELREERVEDVNANGGRTAVASVVD